MRYDMVENPMVLPIYERRRGGGADVSEQDARLMAYTNIERRLARLKMVRARLVDAQEEYDELKALGVKGLRHCDASLVQLKSPGMRLSDEEMHAYQLDRLSSRISADSREIKKVCNALKEIEDDEFFAVLQLYYEKGLSDTVIGDRLGYDRSTVYRHRRRLIKQLACRLYMI